ncbi:sugar transferase [Pedobacter sp. LMG 31464]|uniref:Sugar transferase n=1 Tax=Pedobacter planticolens TaxID=2679964 RepID=A0A923IVJ2_9SPHI|nr:sugar transferase [Pedobacter planticolens]MBB2145918.1 sugar transferase [Pedobacter planticolens]
MLYLIVKRAIDLLVSFILILILFPVLLIIGIAIYISNPGSVIYKQIRMGKGRKVFKLLKFRSMIVNAPDIRNEDGSTFNSENDPRVTKIGRFIRKTSLDELPQLFNVFLGDMSLVGPRPDPIDAVNFYREKDFMRLTVPQGITGWAQVNGRNSISWERRRDYDLEYLQIKSILADIKILIMTFIQVLGRAGINTHDT